MEPLATPAAIPVKRRRTITTIALLLLLLGLVLGLPAAATAASGHITGQVTRAGGVGLGGIAVVAYGADGSGGWQPLGGTTSAVISGAYDLLLEPGTYRLEFSDGTGAYATEWYDDKPTPGLAADVAVTADAATAGVNALLAAAGHIGGRVTRPVGVGVAGIEVMAYHVGGSGIPDYAVDAATSAADGTYALGHLRAGVYRVRFRDTTGTYLTEWFNDKPSGDAGDDVSVSAGGTTSGIDASLTPAGSIAGRLVNTGGTGLGGILVTVYSGPGWDPFKDTRTLADGRYEIKGLPGGAYRVGFSDGSGAYLREYYNDRQSLALADAVKVTSGAVTTGVDAVLAVAGRIAGTVTAGGGAGLEDIAVTVYRPDGSGGWAEAGSTATSASGTYVLGGLSTGSYRVVFEDGAGVYVTECYNDKPTIESGDDVGVTAGATTYHIDAAMVAVGHISGAVCHVLGGAGLSGIWVEAYLSDGSGGWDMVGGTSTLPGGGYELADLPAGTYHIRFADGLGIYADQYYSLKSTSAAADAVVVAGGATTSGVNAVLPLAGHISGTVRKSGGAGLSDVWVEAYLPDGSGGWERVGAALTVAGGTYDVGSLPTGTYRVQFRVEGGAYAMEYYDDAPTIEAADDVAVVAGSTTSGINAVLAAAGHITGTVRDRAGAGLAGISVSAYRADGSGGWAFIDSTTTAAGGTYDLGGLGTGAYRVEFWDEAESHALRYYNDKLTLEEGDDVPVTAGATTSAINASLWPVPVISGLSPVSGPVGTSVGIVGSGLSSATAVSFNGIAAPSFSVVGDTQVRATVPEGAVSGRIAVFTAGGTALSGAFTVVRTLAIASPTAAAGWASGSTQTVAWTLSSAVAVGEFRVWLIGPGGAWYIGKQVLPAAGQTAYSTPLVVSVPAASGYRAAVYWRSAVGSGPWEATAKSAAFTVTPLSIAIPTAASNWPANSTQTCSWTMNPAVATGEFRVWLVSSGGTWYVNKQVLPVAGRTSYSTSVNVAVPVAAGYRAAVYYRPTVGSGAWTATAKSAAFPVSALAVTGPTASSTWPSGSTRNVTWTITPALSTGEFRIWLVSSGGTWYVNQQVLPVAGRTSYSAAVGVSVPAAAGYKAAVYWRPNVGAGSWVLTAKSPSFSVTP